MDRDFGAVIYKDTTRYSSFAPLPAWLLDNPTRLRVLFDLYINILTLFMIMRLNWSFTMTEIGSKHRPAYEGLSYSPNEISQALAVVVRRNTGSIKTNGKWTSQIKLPVT